MRQQDREPFAPSPATSQTAVAEPPVRQLREKPGVLVADDEHIVRSILQLGLGRAGFEVWVAPNGRAAIDLYREHRENIAVVLLDVRMPGLDGPQTLDALRRLNPDVLACFMSGNTGVYDPEELLERGAASVIDKPFHLDQLVDILRLLAHDVSADLLPSGNGFQA
jgi:CheY-like chemotaxis protein